MTDPLHDAREDRAATGAAAWQDPNFAAVFEHAAIGMAIVDMEGHPVRSNPALQRILGYSGEELAAMVFTDFTHPDDASADWELFEELFDGRRDHYQMQKRYFRKDGRLIWGELAVSLVRDEAGMPSYGIGMVTDITERKRAEEALMESEGRFRTILEAAPAAAIVLDAEGRIALVNDQTERLFGYGRRELLGRALDVLIPKQQREPREPQGARYVQHPVAGMRGGHAEFTGRRRDGGEFPMEAILAMLDTEEGRVAIAFVRDLTEQKRQEQELAEAGLRYRTLVEQIPAVVYVWDFRHGPDRPTVPYVSPQIEAILGIPPEAFMADPFLWFERTHDDDRAAVIGETARSVEAGAPFAMEYRMVAADGSVVWVRDEATQILQDDSGKVLIHHGILVDVTEVRRMQDELRTRWDQLQALTAQRQHLLTRLVAAQEDERRQIASNIHDDPIQKMAAVAMRLDLLASSRPEVAGDPAFDKLQGTVRQSIERLRALMFEVRPHTLDSGGLSAALDTLAQIEQDQDGRARYTVDWRSHASIPPATATVVYRIAQEAAVNARKHACARSVTISVSDERGGISLRVADDGAGFDPKVAPATEGAYHLGLGAMRERAAMAGGTFDIVSSPGRGTRVEVWVPIEGLAQAS
jgi:PAS domain S-box-containing protein